MDILELTQEEIIEKIQSLYEKKEFSTLKGLLSQMNPADIASVLDEVTPSQRLLLFRLLAKEEAAETFVELDSDTQESLIHAFSDTELKEVLDELYIDDAVDVVEEMPATVVKRILKNADSKMRESINALLKYPEDSAGSIMTPEFVDLRPDMTAEMAIKRIRRTGVDKETIYTCYVCDSSRKLIGVTTVKELLLHDYEDVIGDFMETNTISLNTLDDQELATQLFDKYNFLALPVVDMESRLVGIITVDDAIDVIQEENTEDLQKMNAMLPTEKTYLKTSVLETWKSRFPWLLLLMISATFTGSIITGFEDKLSSLTILTAFIPMLMDTGGNSGGQASVTVIRAMSLGEVTFKDYFKVIWKEIRVGLLCGSALAVVNFAKIWIVDKTMFHNDEITLMVDLAICTTLVIEIVFAKFIGCSLPMLAKKVGFDPAVMSSPFITTIVDAVSLLVYFGIATAFIPQLH